MWGDTSLVVSQDPALQAKCAIVEVEHLVSVTGGDGTKSKVRSKSRGLMWWLRWVVVVVVVVVVVMTSERITGRGEGKSICGCVREVLYSSVDAKSIEIGKLSPGLQFHKCVYVKQKVCFSP